MGETFPSALATIGMGSTEHSSSRTLSTVRHDGRHDHDDGDRHGHHGDRRGHDDGAHWVGQPYFPRL